MICENITSEEILELEIPDINAHFQKDDFYFLFEVFKTFTNGCVFSKSTGPIEAHRVCATILIFS